MCFFCRCAWYGEESSSRQGAGAARSQRLKTTRVIRICWMKKSWESCTDVYTHVPFVLTKLKISREKSKEKRVFLLSIMFTGNNLFKIFLIDVTRSSDGQNLESIGQWSAWNDSAKQLQEQYGLCDDSDALCRTVNLQIAVVIKRIVRTSCQTKRLPQFYLAILGLGTCFHSSNIKFRRRHIAHVKFGVRCID